MQVKAGFECRVCGESERSKMKDRVASPEGHEKICKPCFRDYAAAYRAENRDRVQESRRKDREAHPERRRAEVARWASRNPEKSRALKRRYRERARGSACPPASAAEIGEMTDDLGMYACTVCGGPAEHLDHIVPLSRGGCGCVSNLQWLCAPCNHSKHARDFFDWLPQRFAALGAS